MKNLLALSFLFLFLTGCGQAVTDTYINAMIDAGKPHCEQVMRDQPGVFESVNIQRDGEENGVVINHVFVAGAENVPSDIKTRTINGLKKNETWDGVMTVLQADVYLKIVFEKSDGTVIGEETITKDDI